MPKVVWSQRVDWPLGHGRLCTLCMDAGFVRGPVIQVRGEYGGMRGSGVAGNTCSVLIAGAPKESEASLSLEDVRHLGQNYGAQAEIRSNRCSLVFEGAPRRVLAFIVEIFFERKWDIQLAGHLGDAVIREAALEFVAEKMFNLAQRHQALFSRQFADAMRPEELPMGGLEWRSHGVFTIDGLSDAWEICELGVRSASDWCSPASGEAAYRVVDKEQHAGWLASCGQTLPQRPSWELRRPVASDSVGETWSAIYKDKIKRRDFNFIQSQKALSILKSRTIWFSHLKENLSKCNRILQVYDFDFDGDPPFIATRPTSAKPLGKVPEVGKLSLEVRVDIVAQVAEALDIAHQFGVVHGAFSARSVLVRISSRGTPRVRLAGFGIPDLTCRPDGDGKVQQRAYRVSRRTDIQAFGLFFWQLTSLNLERPLIEDWERKIQQSGLRDAIKSALSVFDEGSYDNLQAIAAGLRSGDWIRDLNRIATESFATPPRGFELLPSASGKSSQFSGPWWSRFLEGRRQGEESRWNNVRAMRFAAKERFRIFFGL